MTDWAPWRTQTALGTTCARDITHNFAAKRLEADITADTATMYSRVVFPSYSILGKTNKTESVSSHHDEFHTLLIDLIEKRLFLPSLE